MKYIKKPVIIEAVKIEAPDYNPALGEKAFDGSPFSEVPEWLADALRDGIVWPDTPGSTDYAEWHIKTLEGVMLATPGDFIIRGIKGEIYSCKPDIFELTYEPVTHPL